MALERPRRVRGLLLAESLESLAELGQEPAFVVLDFLLAHVLGVLIGGEEVADVVEAEQRLESAVHVAGIADVVQAGQRNLLRTGLLVLLVVFAVECDLTGLIVVILVVGPALIGAVQHLVAHAANHQTLLLHALLAVSLHFSFVHLLALHQVAHLNDQSVSRLDVLVYLALFVSLLSELSAFDGEAAVLDGLHHGLHDWIGGDIAVAFPYLYLKAVVSDSAVLAQE